jgi:MerR family transcriptional regulator/heat shock protein HspR
MSRSIIPRELVAQQLAIPPRVLVRYEQLGLIRVSQDGDVKGYEPAQVRRLWRIISFQRDLGVNLAGVEVILHLHDQMLELHHHLDNLAHDLRDVLEAEEPPQIGPSRSRSDG